MCSSRRREVPDMQFEREFCEVGYAACNLSTDVYRPGGSPNCIISGPGHEYVRLTIAATLIFVRFHGPRFLDSVLASLGGTEIHPGIIIVPL